MLWIRNYCNRDSLNGLSKTEYLFLFFFADTLKIKCYVGRIIIVVKLEIYSICVFYAIFVLSVKNISFNVHEIVFRNYCTDLFLNYRNLIKWILPVINDTLRYVVHIMYTEMIWYSMIILFNSFHFYDIFKWII